MRRALAVIVLSVLLPVQVSASGTWHKTLDEAQAEAKKHNRLIFVEMYADWCGWCKRMDREIFPSEEFHAVAKNLALLKLDTEDRAEGTRLASDLGVHSLPTIVLLTPDLVIAGILSGYSPTTEFIRRIEEAETMYYDFRKRIRDEPASATDEERLELTEELMARRDFAEAAKRFQEHTKSRNPDIRDESYHRLAIAHSMLGEYDKASQVLRKGLSVNAKGEIGERNQYLLAQIYLEQKKYEAALTEYKRFKTNYPESQMVSSVDLIVPQLEREVGKKN